MARFTAADQRQALLERLLDAVKQCQTRFGGRSELATESDSRNVTELVHGLWSDNSDVAFWHFVRTHLTRHEWERFIVLRHVTTDEGRGRAWLRAAFNERSLERYLRAIVADEKRIAEYYESWAFLADVERASMLPDMAAGLATILFAMSVDNPDLNPDGATIGAEGAARGASVRSASHNTAIMHTAISEPVSLLEQSREGSRRRKKRRVPRSQVVSFDENGVACVDTGTGSTTSSVLGSRILSTSSSHDETPPSSNDRSPIPALYNCFSAPPTCLSSPIVGQFPDLSNTHLLNSPSTTLPRNISKSPVGEEHLSCEDLDSSTNQQRAAAMTSHDDGVHLSNQQQQTPVTSHEETPPTTEQMTTNRIPSASDADLHFSPASGANGVFTHNDVDDNDGNDDDGDGDNENCDSSRLVHIKNVGDNSDLGIEITSGDRELYNNCDKSDAEDYLRRKFENSGESQRSSGASSGGSLVVVNRVVERVGGEGKLGQNKPSQSRKGPSLRPINDSSLGELIPVLMDDGALSEDNRSLKSVQLGGEDHGSRSIAVPKPTAAQLQRIRLPSTSSTSSVISAIKTSTPISCSAPTRVGGGGGFADKNFNPRIALSAKENNDNDDMCMSTEELRDAYVILTRKVNEDDERTSALRTLLNKEMELNSGLRAELERTKRHLAEKVERGDQRMRTLAKENESLKQQLKQYVQAVQLLKRDERRAYSAISSLIGEEQEGVMTSSAEEEGGVHMLRHYEHKLIQVAEMHAELMEFNERLQRQLLNRETTIRRLRDELTDLRGPLPDENQTSDDDLSITSDYDASSQSASARPLINIWIPSAFLASHSSDSFHVYQDPKLVEERRKRLQRYLRSVLNWLMQTNQTLIDAPEKATLVRILPFFREQDPAHMRSRSARGSGATSGCFPSSGASSRHTSRDDRNAPHRHLPQHYTGL